MLERNPFEAEQIHPGPYRLGKRAEGVNTYRIGHPLAQRILTLCQALPAQPREVSFDYRGSGKRIAVLDAIVGKGGWLLCTKAAVTAFETEDHILFAGVTDAGDDIDPLQCRRLFDLPGEVKGIVSCDSATRERCAAATTAELQRIIARLSVKNGTWFDAEMDKLDRWADDQRRTLKGELDDLDARIKETKREARSAPNLPTKLDLQRKLRQLEVRRNQAWKEYDASSRDVDRKKESLLDEISTRLCQKTECDELFLIRWCLP